MGLCGDAEDSSTMVPMTYEDMTAIAYTGCFACENLNAAALRENDVYFRMMKLYTDNAGSICKDAIYRLIKAFFDREVLPHLDAGRDWSLTCIRDHFLCHTMYPTDEILTQISATAGLRRHLMNNLAKKDVADGSITFNLNNIKTLIALNKELRVLRQMKKDIPGMVGFDETLNY